MKILMLLDAEFPPDIRVENEAQTLLDAGNEVHILCYNFSTQLSYELYHGIHLHRFKIHKQLAKKMLGFLNQIPLYNFIWKKQIRLIMKQHNFEAVHFNDLPLCSLLRFVKNNFQVTTVADMHENYPYLIAEQPYMNSFLGNILLSKQIWFRKEKEWLAQANHIICVAEEMKNRLSKTLISAPKISVVPNTLNFKIFLNSQKPLTGLKERFAGKFVISFIGGIDAIRGIEYLIDAAQLLKEKIPQLCVLLVGDGKSVDLIHRKVSNYNLQEYVVFEGWQPSSFMQAYIEISDVCIIPHLRSEQTDNSSPNKLFQYMYFGKPVISSNCISIEKIINEENCGLIFTDRDAKELSEQILILFQDEETRKLLGENGRKAVNSKYNWEATSQELYSIYHS